MIASGGALEGEAPLSPGVTRWFAGAPIDDADLPPQARDRWGPRALLAAFRNAFASLEEGELPAPEERAIVVGTQTAALNETMRFAEEVESCGPTLVNPGLFPLTVMNAPAGLAAIRHRCQGANITLKNGPVSVLEAVASAADLVAEDRARIVFSGGFESFAARTTAADGTAAPPHQIAYVVVVARLDRAAEMGYRPRAGVHAFSSGPLGRDRERDRAGLLSAALEADRTAGFEVAECPSHAESVEHVAPLVATAEAVERAAGTERPLLAPVFAGSPRDGVGASLVLRSVR